MDPDRKTTAIRRTAVRETSVFLGIIGNNSGPSESLRTSQHYRIEGFNRSPIMPRHASLSNGWYKFFLVWKSRVWFRFFFWILTFFSRFVFFLFLDLDFFVSGSIYFFMDSYFFCICILFYGFGFSFWIWIFFLDLDFFFLDLYFFFWISIFFSRFIFFFCIWISIFFLDFGFFFRISIFLVCIRMRKNKELAFVQEPKGLYHLGLGRFRYIKISIKNRW